LLSVAAILIAFMVLSKLAFGLWTPMVAVESGSMEPHMQVGDIIFIKNIDRVDLVTNEEGKGYRLCDLWRLRRRDSLSTL